MIKAVKVRKIVIGEGRPKICVPLIGSSPDEIREEARRVLELPADMIEWRADLFRDVRERSALTACLRELRDIAAEKPLLFTLRSEVEGGAFRGSGGEYRDIVAAAASSGCVDLVDVELARAAAAGSETDQAAGGRERMEDKESAPQRRDCTGGAGAACSLRAAEDKESAPQRRECSGGAGAACDRSAAEDKESAPQRWECSGGAGAACSLRAEDEGGAPAADIIGAAHGYGVRVVASYHDFDATPAKAELIGRFCSMQEHDADILKIAVMPRDFKDVLTLMEATEETSRLYAGRPVVGISMGRLGLISRIAAETFGSAMVFAAGAEGGSAPGQISARDVDEMLRIIRETT